MKQRSLRAKLLIFIIVVMLTPILPGSYFYYLYTNTLSDADIVRQQSAQKLSLTHDVIDSFQRQSIAWASFLLRGHKPELYNTHLRKFYREERQTYTRTESLADLLYQDSAYSVDISLTLTKLKDLRKHYRNALEIYNLSDDPYFDTDQSLSPFIADIDYDLQQLIHQIKVLEEKKISALNDDMVQQKQLFLALIIIFLLLSIFIFIWFFDINVGRPITAAISTAKRIADGNIKSRIEEESTREFSIFSKAFNHMIDNLEQANQRLERKINQLQDEVDMRRIAEIKISGQKQILKASRKTIELARQEAVRANQAKSEFLSRMSHELRTPLNAILGFAQLLNMDKLTPEQGNNTNEILTAGEHLLNLINEVLDLSKIESGALDITIEVIDIEALANETLSLVKPLAENRGIQIDIDKQSFAGLQAKGDSTRSKEVFLNLLSNAIKYVHAHGKIWVFCQSKQNMLVVSVCDDGPGIPKEFHHEIFQPFNRLGAKDSEVEGAGIGLAISKRLANAMGGDIEFESEPDKKTCFLFSLPQA